MRPYSLGTYPSYPARVCHFAVRISVDGGREGEGGRGATHTYTQARFPFIESELRPRILMDRVFYFALTVTSLFYTFFLLLIPSSYRELTGCPMRCCFSGRSSKRKKKHCTNAAPAACVFHFRLGAFSSSSFFFLSILFFPRSISSRMNLLIRCEPGPGCVARLIPHQSTTTSRRTTSNAVHLLLLLLHSPRTFGARCFF